MAAAAGRTWVLTVLWLALSCAGQGAYAAGRDAGEREVAPWRIRRDVERFKIVGTDNVMELLNIRPGMTILDVGAGTGQFAYEFARRMNGTGMVYATDVQARCIDYMKKEAERRGLGNLQPVLVKRGGVDEFYGKHRYDLITIFHVAMSYQDQVDYLRELRGYLADGGRLVLILYKIPAPFSAGDFAGNFPGLIRELMSEPEESPYHGILAGSTRMLIRNHPESEPSESLRSAIAEDFNGVLFDSRFTSRFLGGSVFWEQARFLPEERPYADWLFLSLPDRSALSSGVKLLNATGANIIASLNKLLVTQRYRRFLKRDGSFVSGFTAPIGAAFEKAGYGLEHEYADVVPFEDVIVFSAHRAGTAW